MRCVSFQRGKLIPRVEERGQGGRKNAQNVVYSPLRSSLQKMQLHLFPALKGDGEKLTSFSLLHSCSPIAAFVCSLGVDRTLMMDCSGGPPNRVHVKKKWLRRLQHASTLLFFSPTSSLPPLSHRLCVEALWRIKFK